MSTAVGACEAKDEPQLAKTEKFSAEEHKESSPLSKTSNQDIDIIVDKVASDVEDAKVCKEDDEWVMVTEPCPLGGGNDNSAMSINAEGNVSEGTSVQEVSCDGETGKATSGEEKIGKATSGNEKTGQEASSERETVVGISGEGETSKAEISDDKKVDSKVNDSTNADTYVDGVYTKFLALDKVRPRKRFMQVTSYHTPFIIIVVVYYYQ